MWFFCLFVCFDWQVFTLLCGCEISLLGRGKGSNAFHRPLIPQVTWNTEGSWEAVQKCQAGPRIGGQKWGSLAIGLHCQGPCSQLLQEQQKAEEAGITDKGAGLSEAGASESQGGLPGVLQAPPGASGREAWGQAPREETGRLEQVVCLTWVGGLSQRRGWTPRTPTVGVCDSFQGQRQRRTEMQVPACWARGVGRALEGVREAHPFISCPLDSAQMGAAGTSEGEGGDRENISL